LLTALDEPTLHSLQEIGEEAPPLSPPTRTALLAAIKALEPRLTASSRVFFIYAGHGLPGRFLLQPEAGDEAAFTGKELRAAFASLPAERAVLFLDACRAQSMFAERGGDFSAEVAALEKSSDSLALGIL